MLYLVPTPIGNLEDITLRALRILKEVDIIFAEDTRTSGVLLKHYDIKNELRSYHSFNEHQTVPAIVELLSEGKNIALITDAGTPGISDPGFLLVRACKQQQIQVSCLPGATAFVPALAASGIPCNTFHFEGFLPHKKGRHTALTRLSKLEDTFVIYESTHRLQKCIDELMAYCGEHRLACVCRELSKLHEESITDTLSNLKLYYESHSTKGEIVIVVSGNQQENIKHGN